MKAYIREQALSEGMARLSELLEADRDALTGSPCRMAENTVRMRLLARMDGCS